MQETKRPESWREYIEGSFKALGHVGWIWREFMGSEAQRLFVKTLLAVIVGSTFGLAWPYLFGFVIDGVQQGDTQIVIIALLAAFAFDFIWENWQCVVERLGERLGRCQIIDLDTRMTEMFFSKSTGQHLGDSQELSPSNVREGQSAVRGMQKVVLYQLIPILGRAVVLFFLVTWFCWYAGLVALLFVMYTVAWSLHLNRRVMTEGEDLDKRIREVDRYMDERWRSIDRVKAFGKEDEERDRHCSMNTDANDRRMTFWLRYHLMDLIRNITSSTPMFVGFMAFGAWMAMKGEWSVGMILPFLFWGNGFLHSINDLKGIERQINGHLPAIATLKRIMELDPAVKDLPDAIEFKADGPVRVEFRGVSFAHPGKDDGPPKTVLKDVSFKAEQGQKIAIIGPSGAGKTTLLHMLLRSRDPQGGSVHLNGFDLRGLKQSSFKRYLGYAPQNAPLFDGTIRELMLWGVLPEDRESITDEDIWQTLRVVQADLGERFEKGLDTTIGRDGIELSGGEHQRLSAAIALMNPQLRLLIMDEPTSNLDWETQQGFQDGLNAALDRGVTVFMVAHRLSTVRDCDRFVVLKPVSELKDDESQVETVASSFEELYEISPTFRRVAKGEGLKFGPKIVTELKDMPVASASFLDGKVTNLLA